MICRSHNQGIKHYGVQTQNLFTVCAEDYNNMRKYYISRRKISD